MSPIWLQNELIQIGKTLNRWQAEVWGVLWMSGVLTGLWLFALSDLFLRYERLGRFVLCGILAIILAAGLWQIIAALRKKWSVPAIAARIERAFPALDNHLINYVQFAAHPPGSSLEALYVERGVPEWNEVEVSAMRNRRKLLQGCLVLGMAGLLMITPGAWTGTAWLNSLVRILNPFSQRAPVTLAVIERVHPGNLAVLTGEPITLSCAVSGKKGQDVYLDLWPADDKKNMMKLGRLTGAGVESFSFRLPKVTTAFQYRFRAGDAASTRYSLRVFPPLAFTGLEIMVSPPAHTRLETRIFDGLSDTVPIPKGSVMSMVLQCNRELRSAVLVMTNTEPVTMTSEDTGKTWKGKLSISAQKPLIISAVDSNNLTAETSLKYELLSDKPPTIRVLAPTARTCLNPGTAPRVQWEVTDDFGISAVRLEQINSDERHQAQPVVLKEWTVANAREFATNWSGETTLFNMKEPLVLRIVAVDNNSVGEPHRAQSPPILFDWTSANKIQSKTQETVDQAANSLSKLVELQRTNLEKTTQLDAALTSTEPSQWKEAADVQTAIMKLAGQLIAHPSKPLGPLTASVKELHQGAMREAIDLLERVPVADAAKKPTLSQRAIMLETRILRILMRVEDGIDDVKRNREVTGLLALLDSLVKGQETTLENTKACAIKSELLGEALVQKQDRLAGDAGTFVQSCRSEAKTQSANDKEFSQLLIQIADGFESKKVSANMLRAAEHLQNKAPVKAIPLQTEVLTALKEFQKLLNEWRVEEAKKTLSEFQEALKIASRKMDKLIKVETKVAEAIRETARQEDKDKKKTDALEEDLQKEMNDVNKNVEESLLQIATDLQIFPELPVGNDLVEDVFQVFEEVKQVPGSEKKPVKELGLQKEDFILDLIKEMQDTKERIDDMETWLFAEPDRFKRNMENFDLQEMPKYPIIPMPSEMEDIIGDLLKQEEEIEKQRDDSATNQGTADFNLGADIFEAEFANYSAKGKSAMEKPQHKEQDGRSNIGREGMSDGETAAGSGKINVGDEKIDKRMTQESPQSGQIQEDGHTKAKATGGGKLSGYGDELGMAGSGPRRDSNVKQGSELGLQAMLRRNAQAIYARAQLSHLRTGSLDEALHHMQQAEDAIANGWPIQQVREFQRLAVAALKKTQTQLGADVITEVDFNQTTPTLEDDQLAGTRDEAPANYRELVSEYFKTISSSP